MSDLQTAPVTFAAHPGDAPARFVTAFFWVFVAGVWLGTGSLFSDGADGAGLLMGGIAVALAVLALACRRQQPTGYTVDEGGLVVLRRGGPRRFAGPLHGAAPRAFDRGDLRLLGTGGLYGYVGRFRLKPEGWVRAQLTSGRHGVLVSVGDQRVLVSPDDPHAFAAAAGGSDA